VVIEGIVRGFSTPARGDEVPLKPRRGPATSGAC
jgi:hypothetical protein